MRAAGLEPECANCGTRLPPSARRCHVCGAPVQPAHQVRRCPQCGTPAAQRAKTCLMCAAPLDQAPTRRVAWAWLAALVLFGVLIAVGWNRWRHQPGAELAVATTALPSPTRTPTAAQTATPTAQPSHTPAPALTATPIIHEVQSGETVIYIASYYGTSPDAILQANGLDENSARLLRTGQQLIIPSTGAVGGPVPGGAAQPPQVIHEVESGETLISIAIDYDTTVEAIMAVNNLESPDLIYVGQQLLVPLMPPTATGTPTPTATPSSTPSPPYPAPHLLTPGEGALFEGETAVVLLSWTSVGILRENQVYLLEVETPGHSRPATYITQGTSWRLPLDLRPTGRRYLLAWRVTVVQRANSTSDALEWKPLSPPSQTRHLVWR